MAERPKIHENLPRLWFNPNNEWPRLIAVRKRCLQNVTENNDEAQTRQASNYSSGHEREDRTGQVSTLVTLDRIGLF